ARSILLSHLRGVYRAASCRRPCLAVALLSLQTGRSSMNSPSALSVQGKHRIAGRWVDAADKSFESHNPAHWDQIVGKFPLGTAETANQAVAAARAAYPAWRRTSRIKRADLFDNLAQLIKRDTDKLAELMARECGKVVTECRAEVVEGL